MLDQNRDSSEDDQSDRTGQNRKASIQLWPTPDEYFTEDEE